MNDNDRLVTAIATIYETLPDLIGREWAEFEGELITLLRQLEGEEIDTKISQEAILALFQQHPKAYQILTGEVKKLTPIKMRGMKRPTTLTAAEGGMPVRYTTVPVYFGTDREQTNDAKNEFSGQRSKNGEVNLGIANVSIPDDHRMGKMEKPKIWKLQFSLNPDKHIMLQGVEHLEHSDFVNRARADIASAENREALVFIHGYNVKFNDALERTAQVSYDLHFGGLTLAYSWPSEGQTKKYTIDEANVSWSRPHFKKFLKMVMTELGAETVHVIAHSMGNRILTDVMPSIEPSDLPAGSARLREVVFAAPDVDAGTFAELATQFHGRADRFTLYASSNDLALAASKLLHKYSRAGDSGEDLVVIDNVDTVDASELDTGLMGHAYYGDNRSVISDLILLIKQSLHPEERNLRNQKKDGKDYWLFKP